MRISRGKGAVAIAGAVLVALAGCTGANTPGGTEKSGSSSYTITDATDGQTAFKVVTNPNGGAQLSFSAEGNMKVIEVKDGEYTYAFKDTNGNGELDKYEDWREEAKARAQALAAELSMEQIGGLMLFSSHERAPGDGLTDNQKTYLSQSHLRAVLHAGSSEVKPTVQWVNEMQAYVETLAAGGLPYVPVNYSSDPRSDASKTGSFTEEGEISKWPSSLGLAATFSPETVLEFGKSVSAEYRALGLGTALSPQIDLATEPRWLRVSGTFGEDVEMASAMAKAYVDGFQNTYAADGSSQGWGHDSVNAMIKHWPGDGAGEGGRESHTNAGKYAVFPGANQAQHQAVFKAAIDATAVMTSYSITTDGEGKALYKTLTGTSYDPGRLDALRVDNGYQGVVVTDWGVTAGGATDPGARFGMAWGAGDLTVAQRHFEILKNGTDMFGGNNALAPVMAAYDLWQQAYVAGELEIDAATRFQQSAERILALNFYNGTYDDPYLDLEAAKGVVGSADKVSAGQEAQLNSVVVLKNSDGTIKLDEKADWSDKTVYIPQSYDTGFNGLFGEASYTDGPTLDLDTAAKYFGTVVTDEVVYDENERVVSYTAPDLSNVDVVLVGMDSPNNGSSFTSAGLDRESGEFYPLTLQYRPYTADGANVRKTSIAGDTLTDGAKENRSYFGKTSRISNEADLDAFERAVAAVKKSGKDIPVITVLKASNAVIPTEFEAASDAVVVGFGTADEALIKVALGLHESKGRLPIQFPADMNTVEANQEDVPKDVTPYTDSQGNTYNYGFGLGSDGKPITG